MTNCNSLQFQAFPSYCTVCDVQLDVHSFSPLYCSEKCQLDDCVTVTEDSDSRKRTFSRMSLEPRVVPSLDTHVTDSAMRTDNMNFRSPQQLPHSPPLSNGNSWSSSSGNSSFTPNASANTHGHYSHQRKNSVSCVVTSSQKFWAKPTGSEPFYIRPPSYHDHKEEHGSSRSFDLRLSDVNTRTNSAASSYKAAGYLNDTTCLSPPPAIALPSTSRFSETYDKEIYKDDDEAIEEDAETCTASSFHTEMTAHRSRGPLFISSGSQLYSSTSVQGSSKSRGDQGDSNSSYLAEYEPNPRSISLVLPYQGYEDYESDRLEYEFPRPKTDGD